VLALAVAVVPWTVSATPATTAPTPVVAAATTYISKKDSYLADKRPVRRAAPKVTRKPPPPVINLRNTWTEEWLALEAAGPLAVAPAQLDRFLRDHYTNDPTSMDPRLLAVLREAANHFGVRRIEIVSGFRAPKYNLMLRKKGHEVARDSQHTHGTAVDFRLPGVTTEALHAWAVGRKLGGVGIYRKSQFVHMDTGRVRYWSGD
jgi:uncharacterized protein YcbK (DUF882 family)